MKLPLTRALFVLAALCAFGLNGPGKRTSAAETTDPERFEKDVLVSGLADGTEMDVLPDGRILICERFGAIKLYRPETGKTVRLGRVPTIVYDEVGCLGIVADLNFAKTGWFYVFYSPEEEPKTMRVSRFTVEEDTLVPDSEKKILAQNVDTPNAFHLGGGLTKDSKGNIFIGIGDNSPPIPELPVDQRPGREQYDALRSAGNSMDFRGKILRIHPEPDGTYTIPEGNLFPDGKQGRPEIYVMGTRNPYRMHVDFKNDWLYWGDVGPNVTPEIKLGPMGYDEINLAKKAGNFGWPMFVGPNEGYGMFDFETRKRGVRFDPANPVNPSKNNTGLKQLPPPQKPLIWYPTTESAEFPELGSGGRSILSGPVYHFDPQLKSEIKLPEAFDNCLFIGEWMRNWVKVVQLDADAKFVRIVSLPETLVFRRPLDLRIGPEGALYTLEYGDKWNGNTDGQITRLIYRRGNRAPRIAVQSKNTAGKTPLTASFNANKSTDPDAGDALTYEYQIGNGPVQKAKSPEFSLDFREAGVFPVKVTAVDSHGAKASQTIDVRAGNALPRVKFLAPVDGTFFDWNQPVGTKVEVDDDEDGSSRDGKIPADRVAFRAEYYQRYPGPNGEGLDPGYALMRKTTCFGCHTSEGNSKGPAYQAVALKYKDQPTARETLAKKIITGGAGVWGAYPMPPHPQHTPEQTQQMVNWILSLASGPAPVIDAGTDAAFLAPAAPQSFLQTSADAGVYQLTASYTDQGAEGAVPLTGEASIVLHARRKKPAYADASHGIEVIHELEGEQGLVGRLSEGDHFAFRRVNLAGIAKIVCRGMQVDGDKGELVAHLDNPNGPVLARFDLHRSQFGDIAADITPPEGIHDLYFVGHGSGTSKKPLRVHWLEFQPSADVQPKLATEREALRKLIADRQKQRAAAQRAFVRNWTLDDLSPKLADLDRGRSFAKGAELFRAAACANCHRVRETGGQIGPNLTEVAQRMAKKPEPRLALLREVVDPSAVIEDKFRTLIVVTDDGQQMAGLVVGEDPTHLKLAANPARPEEVITLSKARIEESRRSDVSLMPVGLLNTLSAEEILDLLAYIESGGDATQKRFTEPRTK